MNGAVKKADKKRSNGSKKKPVSFPDNLTIVWDTIEPHIAYVGVLVVSLLFVYLLIRPISAIDIRGFQIGQPSPRLVISPIDFVFEDKEKTSEKQREAQALVSPIFQIQPEPIDRMLEKIQQLETIAQSIPARSESDFEIQTIEILGQLGFQIPNRPYELSENGSESLPQNTYEGLAFYKGNKSFWNAIKVHAQDSIGRGIADDNSAIRPAVPNPNQSSTPQRLSAMITFINPDGSRFSAPGQNIKTSEEFFQEFQTRIKQDFPDSVKDAPARELALDIVKAAYSGPSLLYRREETEALRKQALEEVEPVLVHINKEETIVGKNEIVTQYHLTKLQELRDQMKISPLAEVGYFILAILYIAVIWKYLRAYEPRITEETRKLAVIFLAVLLIFSLSRIAVHISLLDFGIQKLTHIGYAIPLGALGVILTLLVNSRMALFTCALTAFYIGIIISGGTKQDILSYILVTFITSYGAIHTVTRIRQRSDLYRAGGIAMFLACITILALSINQFKSFDQFLSQAGELKWALIWGAVNGGLISILSMALLPIFEDFYGIVTDMKLLELGQKTELLQKLEQEAPGSYQHSMRVATLAESAAESIGANALLARVGCYYHDIGKSVSPHYFVENQQTSADKAKHSKLSINMSCFIIRSHVKHGIELAKKYNLPKVIIDFIPEHHGTTLMSYFYHQALENQEAEGTIKEEDFRYPGPKPQSKETAIAMLSDALEAASRTLDKGSEREVRQLVRKIINERFMDGQFDECNLTLKDLHTLFLSFSDSIIHMLHQRIVYPSGGAPTKKDTDLDRHDDRLDMEKSTVKTDTEKPEKKSSTKLDHSMPDSIDSTVEVGSDIQKK